MAKVNKQDSEETSYSQPESSPNPAWFKPIMFGFLLVGFLIILLYYFGGTQLPIPGFGNYNLVMGFGVLLVGLLMTTRWR